MAYITELHIEGELSYAIETTTQPTTAEVGDVISDVESEVNGRLYSVGVSVSGLDATTTPIAWRVVKQIVLWGVCSRVIAAAGGLIRAQTGKEKDYWDRYEAKLKAIEKDPRILGSDTPFLTSASDLEFSYITSGDDEYYGPVFRTRDEF